MQRPAVKTRKIRGLQIYVNTKRNLIESNEHWGFFPMGYKLLKTKTLVLENGHLWKKMTVGFSHLA